MNIDKILSDEYYTFLENNHNVAFYSLSIGLEEYFETYHSESDSRHCPNPSRITP